MQQQDRRRSSHARFPIDDLDAEGESSWALPGAGHQVADLGEPAIGLEQ